MIILWDTIGPSRSMLSSASSPAGGGGFLKTFNIFKRKKSIQRRYRPIRVVPSPAVTEEDFASLNSRIDKLLAKIDDSESEIIQTEAEEECVVCLAAKATMQTYPCGHTVVCRKCFIKTIQMALSQRCLPLRCVICRTRILKLRQLSETKSRETSEPKKRSQQNHFKLLPRIRQFKASMKAK